MNQTELLNTALLNLVPWVVFLPIIGLLINILLGRFLGEKVVGWIASLAVGLAFIVSIGLALALYKTQEPFTFILAEWMSAGTFQLDWAFRVDALSVTMMLVVSGVGTLIHVYAIGYMHDDVRLNGDPQRFRRFFVYFNLFIAAMMLLVSANNFLVMFVGWEGVGLCSYLLIGFWFEKGAEGLGNARAGKKAFIVNRIGDFGLLIALFLIVQNFGSFNFDVVFAKAPEIALATPAVLTAITLFMFLGVTGKSAQLPLYVWLPDAMAGPTPVSALIHAATMVTAGVYLVARSAVFFNLVPFASGLVTWVGALTAIFAATIAVGQFDIKKVLAYSTISQLGFMVAAVGMGAYIAALFHLATHAFFKALLFLDAGSVIQGVERGHHASLHDKGQHGETFDPQDMRNMGGLQKTMPLTTVVYVIGALALAGIAPLAGFFSKDEILASASIYSPAILVILAAAAFLTAFYMGRQGFMVFFSRPRTAAAEKATESPAIMTVPLIILAVLSVLGGLINLPGLNWLEHWLEETVHTTISAGFILWVAGLSFGLALLGLFIAWLIYGRRSLGTPETPDPLQSTLGPLFTALQKKWWVDELYHALIVRPFRYISDEVLASWMDQEVIDGAVNDLGGSVRFLSHIGRFFQNGYIRVYALSILFGAIVIMTVFILK